ncbi:flagellar biosynthetic protein FliR [Vibrio sp. SS-MA-C1-2]|uniref:flagellar biosynthetic protein FliR n=1 Tax=Vibrio sp. SS-MA-C1-2 TaxID=2908646 RepID=UPI001F3F8186|nr:flagellar biosynthetic protein FliR [Vibrio sp. SS-MA-C1-2]UJF18012.1 flagellar biosynthetic protein FliR [Vibrio sp. SS-MA-C1-2]
MEITFAQITQWLGYFWWPFVRCAGFFIFSPIYGDGAVPSRVKILLAMIFAFLLMPIIESAPPFNPFSFTTVLITFYQLLFGAMIGFSIMLFFTIYTMAGQAISMQMGLAMAIMNDPSNGISVAIIGRFFLILCTLLFLSFDAHLVILAIFKESFELWPLDNPIPYQSLLELAKMFSWVIASALMMALPAIVIMLMSNIAFGVMNKAAPSLNVFALGFPMTMVLGMFALAISLTGVGDSYLSKLLEMQDYMRHIMGL